MLSIKTFEFNMLPVNTYVVWDESKEAVVIDCGCYYEAEKQTFKQFVADNGLKIVRLLDTHLHFDHVFGNPFMWQEFGIKAEAHKADLPWLEHMSERIQAFGIRECELPVPLKGYLDEGDIVRFGHHEFTVLHVPGHSWGGGGEDLLLEGIREKLLSLPDDTGIYPGHGPISILSEEKRYNIYLRQ